MLDGSRSYMCEIKKRSDVIMIKEMPVFEAQYSNKITSLFGDSLILQESHVGHDIAVM